MTEPKIYLGYWYGILDQRPEELPKEMQEMRKEIEKAKVPWFEALLVNWQVLYGQCLSGMTAKDCIDRMDINRCNEAASEMADANGEDDGSIGGFGKGTCYALAAILKKNITICDNQFYLGTEMNCHAWLENLSIDCRTCAKEFLVPESANGYFNWLDGAKASMRDISFCEAMVDQGWKDGCFSSAASALKNEGYCARVSEELQFPETGSSQTRRDTCYSMFVMKTGKKDVCDKIKNSQSRELCRY